MSQPRVYEWYNRFREGRDDVEDDARPGRLSTSITSKKVEKIKTIVLSNCTRSVRKVSGLPLYLRAIVFGRPLRGMNVSSKTSRTYRLLADICRTYSSCAECLCLQSYF